MARRAVRREVAGDAIKKALRVQGNNTGSVVDLRGAARSIEAAGIVPVVDSVFGLDDARGAYERLAGGHFGKIVIAH